MLLFAAFSFRLSIARDLANDGPEDGRVYAQIARNILEQHVYSHESEPPYSPSLIRLPGYPLLLAGIYSVFGHNNNSAVRVTEALIDTTACALIAVVAYYWEPDQKRKRSVAVAALALAAFCPFTAIYVATILTETPTVFLVVAMCFTATLALRTPRLKRSLTWWTVTGLLAGIAVLFRPDSGLFAGALGLTLVLTTVFHRRPEVEADSGRRQALRGQILRMFAQATLFSAAFVLVLVPWTLRNRRVFHLFQPLAPAHAEMPGEFVARGYLAWLRTWLDDQRYVDPMLWSLNSAKITLDRIPQRAFDSAEERKRVGALLDQYNDPPQALAQAQPGTPAPTESPSGSVEDLNQRDKVESGGTQQATPSPEVKDQGEGQDQAAEDEEGDVTDQEDEHGTQSANEQETEAPALVEMTPDIDAGFARIARERIARAPLRYYVLLPLKRAVSLWFDTHSQYYPFTGELFPLKDLDHEIHQHIWLPLFIGLTLVYTLLGVMGGWFLWRSRRFLARCWLLLAALMIFIRLGFFSTIENPEPRYVVEAFPLLCMLGAIAIARMGPGTLRRKPVPE